MASANLDIFIIWKNLSDTGICLDLALEGTSFEANIHEPRLVFFIEKFLEQGTLKFHESEEFLEAFEWWQLNLSTWTGQNAQYASELHIILQKIKQRLNL